MTAYDLEETLRIARDLRDDGKQADGIFLMLEALLKDAAKRAAEASLREWQKAERRDY